MSEGELHISPKLLAILLGATFLGGTFVGYQLKTYRMKYLHMKRDFFERKLRETDEKFRNSAGMPEKKVLSPLEQARKPAVM